MMMMAFYWIQWLGVEGHHGDGRDAVSAGQ